MNSKLILFIGLFVSIIYVLMVVNFYNPKLVDAKHDEVSVAKFLYVLKDKHIEVISKLSTNDKNSSLILQVESICQKYSCKKSISFSDDIDSSPWLKLLGSLVDFSLKNDLNSSSFILNNNILEINFALRSRVNLESLISLYVDYKNKLTIIDKSSIVKFYSIENIENDLNTLLKTKSIKIETLELTKDSKKLLNQLFRRVRELGNIKVSMFSQLDEVDRLLLRDYVLKTYPWVKELYIKSSDFNKIKIEEVLK